MKLCDKKYALLIVAALSFLILVYNGNDQTYGIVDNQSTATSMNGVNITMSRGPCHGTCPVYSLEIDGTGKVVYRGHEHVNVTGERTSYILPEKVTELINQFNNSGYFNLKDKYDQIEITDQPTVETSIRLDGTFKSIYDYLGTIKLPELVKLRQLENMIDEVTNSSQWIGSQVNLTR